MKLNNNTFVTGNTRVVCFRERTFGKHFTQISVYTLRGARNIVYEVSHSSTLLLAVVLGKCMHTTFRAVFLADVPELLKYPQYLSGLSRGLLRSFPENLPRNIFSSLFVPRGFRFSQQLTAVPVGF